MDGAMSLPTLLRARILSLLPRRRARRGPSTLPIEWRRFGSSVRHLTRVADLSPGGAFVYAGDPQPVGSPLVLDMPSPRGVLNVHARVAWTGPSGMGLRFTRRLG
jgi:hypothetical protein